MPAAMGPHGRTSADKPSARDSDAATSALCLGLGHHGILACSHDPRRLGLRVGRLLAMRALPQGEDSLLRRGPSCGRSSPFSPAVGDRGLLPAGFGALTLVFAAGAVLATYHAGVEWHLWAGPASCTGSFVAPAKVEDFLHQLQTSQRGSMRRRRPSHPRPVARRLGRPRLCAGWRLLAAAGVIRSRHVRSAGVAVDVDGQARRTEQWPSLVASRQIGSALVSTWIVACPMPKRPRNSSARSRPGCRSPGCPPGHHEMSRHCGFGRAHRPDVQVVHLRDAGLAASSASDRIRVRCRPGHPAAPWSCCPRSRPIGAGHDHALTTRLVTGRPRANRSQDHEAGHDDARRDERVGRHVQVGALDVDVAAPGPRRTARRCTPLTTIPMAATTITVPPATGSG